MKAGKDQGMLFKEDAQAMMVWDCHGDIAAVQVPNQYDPCRDKAHNERLLRKVLNGKEATLEDLIQQ